MSDHGLTARSASITIGAQVVARAVSLLAVVGSTAIVARTVGIDEYATWATVVTLTALVAFALDPGISPIVVRRLAQDPATSPSPEALAPVRLALGAVALAVIIGLSAVLRGGDAVVLALALGGQVLPRALVLNATPWLQLDHRLHRQTVIEAACAAGGVALLSASALLDAPTAVLAAVGFTGPTAILAVLMRRELAITPSRQREIPGPQRERVRSLLREVAPLAFALVLVSAYTRTAVFFLNRSADDDEVAHFLFAFQFIEQIIVVAGIVAGAVLPLLAIRARGAALLRDPITHELVVAVGAIGALISAVLLATAVPLTRVIGGPELAPAAADLQRLAPVAVVIFTSFLLAYVYVSAGMAQRYLVFNLIVLGVNVVAGALLTSKYGSPASARISWGSEALVVVMAGIPIARGGGAGLRALVIAGTLIAAAVVASEFVAADRIPPAAGALGLIAVVGLLAGRPLARLARSVTSPSEPAT